MAVIDPSAAKAAQADDGGASNIKAAKAGAKAGAPETSQVSNPDGTFTVTYKFPDGAVSKTYVDPQPFNHTQNSPSDQYIAKVKAKLEGRLNGDQLGEDTNGDGMYAGKSLEAGGGGRTQILHDRMTMELVKKGYGEQDAARIANKQAAAHGVKKYGAEQMAKWGAKGKGTAAAPAAAKSA